LLGIAQESLDNAVEHIKKQIDEFEKKIEKKIKKNSLDNEYYQPITTEEWTEYLERKYGKENVKLEINCNDNIIELLNANDKTKNVIKELPGTTGKWNKNLNKVTFEPNSKIQVGNNAVYETNEKGLVSKVTGTFDKNISSHSRNQYQQTSSVKLKDGLKTDQGGHIIAAQNGGAGEQINYIPMTQKLNQGSFKAFENEINQLSKEHSVKTVTNLGYDSGTKRPDWLNIEWWVDGVKQPDKFFLNDNSAY